MADVSWGDLFGEDEAPQRATAEQTDTAAGGVEVSLDDIFGADDVAAAPAHTHTHTHTGADAAERARERAAQRAAALAAKAAAAVQAAKESADRLHIPAIPRIAPADAPSSTHTRTHTVRLPAILSVARGLYDADTYDEAKEDAELRATGRYGARESLIRFRPRADGGREGNARVVEWNDGSMTLHVGKETFLLTTQRAGVGGKGASSAGHTQLYARTRAHVHPAGHADDAPEAEETVLQAQALVSHRVLVRALEGTTVAYASLVQARAGDDAHAAEAGKKRRRAGDHGRIEQVPLTTNPELERQARIRDEEQAARALARQQAAGRTAAGALGAAGGYATRTSSGVGADEEAEFANDDDTFNVRKIKAGASRARQPAKRAAATGRRRAAFEDEEEEDEVSDSEASESSGSESDSESDTGSESSSGSSGSSGTESDTESSSGSSDTSSS